MSNRILRCGVLLALVLLLAGTTALAADYPYDTVTNNNVNMRRNASSSSTVLERLDDGDRVTVLGESGNYFRVSYNGRTGYIMKQYIVVPGKDGEVQTATGYPYGTTAKDDVNMRSRAAVSSSRITVIPQGASVTVLGVEGSFAKITYNGRTGYAMTAYLNMKKIVEESATPAPTANLGGGMEDSGYVTLRKGDIGSAVKALQSALKELGFLSGAVDGKFGSGTEKALIAFQKANGYPETGIADANLQAFLYNGKVVNAAGKKTTVNTLAPISGVNVTLNKTGELVETLQTRLKELGYYAGDVTGVYDSATRKAVIAFQKKHNLTADGVAGSVTQVVLLGNGALSAEATPTATPTLIPTPTPTPTAVPTYDRPGSTVRRGSSGTDAKMVQRRLKELGYYRGTVDGKFGSASVKALETFQNAHGLNADGVAGRATYDILFSYKALKAGTTYTPAPTDTPAPVTAAPTATMEPVTENNVVTIRLGTTGTAVAHLQTRLTVLGYYEATVDGVCKADDVAAIKTFQQMNGLKVDGVAGYDTQSRMYSVSALTATGAIAGGTVDEFTTLRKGMSGEAVKQMQQRLIQLGYLSGTADGKYGTDTAEAVYNFQKMNGILRDGIAGAQTLAKLYSATAVKPTAAPTATPRPTSGSTSSGSSSSGSAEEDNEGIGTTVRQGDSNEAVRTLQEFLIDLGYLSGKADGDFGIKTYRALVAFQSANKLSADGIAGSKTWNKLTSSGAIASDGATAKPAATPTVNVNASQSYLPRASAVRYANWYDEIRAVARKYPYATVYDFSTGISWQVHMFSLGKHADSETVTAADTAKMLQAFGKNTWNPKAVWVVFADGSIYMASTHSMEHGVEHNPNNNFEGHFCIHFPRTAAEVAAIGPYATSHQKKIDEGWQITQAMIR